jgi:hypothetical protein
MDCKKFRKHLENYLEDGLDFPARFGIERHAQQCISCGKDMADAQRIRQMVSEMGRVKAPENFEASVIGEIAKRRLKVRTAGIRRFWLYGHEAPLGWKLALASSSLAVLAIGIFAFISMTGSSQDPASTVAMEEPGNSYADMNAMQNPAANGVISPILEQPASENAPAIAEVPAEAEVLRVAASPENPEVLQPEFVTDWDTGEVELIEHLMMGPDGRPVTIQLPMPRKIYMQYNQTPEDYYIQNISH